MQRTQTSTASDMLRRLCHWKQVLNSTMCICLLMATWWPTSKGVTGLVLYPVTWLSGHSNPVLILSCSLCIPQMWPSQNYECWKNKLTLWFRDHHCYIGIIKILPQASEILHLSRRNRHQKNKNFHLQALHRNHTPVFCVLSIPAIPDDSPVTVCHT